MSNWISVHDKLPCILDDVLVAILNDSNDSFVCEATYQIDGEFITKREMARLGTKAMPCVDVTHWMPLPEPPSND